MYKPFKIHSAKGGGFYLTTVAENGRTLDTTEVYKRRRTCIAKVKTVFRLTKSLVPEKAILNYIEDLTVKPKQL